MKDFLGGNHDYYDDIRNPLYLHEVVAHFRTGHNVASVCHGWDVIVRPVYRVGDDAVSVFGDFVEFDEPASQITRDFAEAVGHEISRHFSRGRSVLGTINGWLVAFSPLKPLVAGA